MKEASALSFSLSIKTLFVFLNNDCHQRQTLQLWACSKSRQSESAAALCINYLAYVALYKQDPLVERWIPVHSQLLQNVSLIHYWGLKSCTGCCAPDPVWSGVHCALIRTRLTGVDGARTPGSRCEREKPYLHGSVCFQDPWHIIRAERLISELCGYI